MKRPKKMIAVTDNAEIEVVDAGDDSDDNLFVLDEIEALKMARELLSAIAELHGEK